MDNEGLKISIDATIEGLQKALNKANAQISKFSQDIEKKLDRVAESGKKMKNLGSNMSKYVSLPLAGIGTLAVKTAADFEKLNVALLTTFQGNEKAAKSAFNQITKFASETPFQVEQVASAFIKLKNMGLDPSERALTSYGDTASAMGKSLDQMVEAVADAATGEFERLKEFGIRASKQGDRVKFTFRGVTEEVAFSSNAIQEYLMKLGETKFAGGMEKQSKTFLGVLSTLKDNIALLGNEIGNILFEYINPLVDKIAVWTQKFRELSPETKKYIVIAAALAAALGPLLVALGAIVSIAPAIGTAFTVMFGPIGLITAAVVGLATALYMNWDSIKQGLVDTANYFIDLYNEITPVRIAVEAVIMMFKNMMDAGKFAVDTLIMPFKKLYKVITGELSIKDAFKSMLTDTQDNFSKFTDNIKQNAEDLARNIENRRPRLEIIADVKTKESGTNNVGDTQGAGDSIVSQAKKDIATMPEFLEKANAQIGIQAQIARNSFADMFTIDDSLVESFASKLTAVKDMALDITSDISDTFSNMAESIGYAFANGDNAAKAGGAALLAGLGGILTKFGKLVMAAGFASEGLKAALKNPFGGGVAAIAAGAALIAIGGAVKAFSSNLASSASTGGGTNPEFTGGASVGTPYASSNVSSRNVSSYGGGEKEFVFKIAGTDLISVMQKTMDRNKSLGGTTLSFS